MAKRKPCLRCGRPKPPHTNRVCGSCSEVDAIWDQLRLDGDCWIWPGPYLKGYGRYGGRLVHRLTYTALISDIPDQLDLDHLCRVTACANPWHLEPVTRAENNRRKVALQTSCKWGHEFTSANTYLSRGKRNCRTCANEASRQYRARKAVAA